MSEKDARRRTLERLRAHLIELAAGETEIVATFEQIVRDDERQSSLEKVKAYL